MPARLKLFPAFVLCILAGSAFPFEVSKSYALAQQERLLPDTTQDRYKQDCDADLFRDEKLELLPGMDERAKWLEADQRQVFFYDTNWNLSLEEQAEFICSVKRLKGNDYLVKNYFASGERKSAAVYQLLDTNFLWSALYRSGEDKARISGKYISWKKIGEIEWIEFYKWENDTRSKEMVDPRPYQEPRGTEFKIKNTSNLKVDLLYEQDSATAKLELPKCSGDIQAMLHPGLCFLFENNAISVHGKQVSVMDKPRHAGLPPVYNSKHSPYPRYSTRSSLGWINLDFTAHSGSDTDYHTFLLENKGDIRIDGLLNTELFLLDADGDGTDEVYLFSYASCGGSLKLIRISL